MNRNVKADAEMEKLGYITVQQAAHISGKDVATIYRWAREQLIRSERVGPGQRQAVYIDEKSLNEVIGPMAVKRVKA